MLRPEESPRANVAPNPDPEFDFQPAAQQASNPAPSKSRTSTKKGLGRFRSPTKETLTPTDSVKSRNLKRRIVIGAVLVSSVALLGNFVAGVVSPPPSADQVAASVTDSIFADEQYSPFVSAATQFLEIYLMPALTPEEEDARLEQLNLLTAGLGGAWVTGEVTSGKASRIVRGPYLSGEPTPVNTALVPRAVSLPFQVWMQAPSGEMTRVQFSVTVASSRNPDTGAFTVYVPLPPSLVSATVVEEQDAPEIASEDDVSAAAAPQLQQYLKLWAAFDASTATDAQTTSLKSYLATSVARSAVSGLSGEVSLESLDSVALISDDPANPTMAEGLVTVTWKSPATGVLYAASYQVAMVNEANRWLVRSITPLGS